MVAIIIPRIKRSHILSLLYVRQQDPGTTGNGHEMSCRTRSSGEENSIDQHYWPNDSVEHAAKGVTPLGCSELVSYAEGLGLDI